MSAMKKAKETGFRKKKKKVKKVSLWKITKESFDLNALCEFPNLEVIEIAGFDEFKPLS